MPSGQKMPRAFERVDMRQAEQALDRAFAFHDVETVATEIILRGLREVGGGWQRGEVTVQQEHFTSVQAMRCLHDLIADLNPLGGNLTEHPLLAAEESMRDMTARRALGIPL